MSRSRIFALAGVVWVVAFGCGYVTSLDKSFEFERVCSNDGPPNNSARPGWCWMEVEEGRWAMFPNPAMLPAPITWTEPDVKRWWSINNKFVEVEGVHVRIMIDGDECRVVTHIEGVVFVSDKFWYETAPECRGRDE